jgi:hypothetical protein
VSNYVVVINDDTRVRVGWDRPLQTYFGQVFKVDKEGEQVEERDGTIFWIGPGKERFVDLERFAEQMRPYVELSPQLLDTLRADKDNNR